MTQTEQSTEPRTSDKVLEVVIAILLAITTLLTAWATWIGSLHGGLQSINFTKSNNYASTATAAYNEASQLLIQEVVLWNSIQAAELDVEAATANGDSATAGAARAKLESLEALCTPELKEAIDWARETGKQPFEKEGYQESYYEHAAGYLEQSQQHLKDGMRDNTRGDAFGLVTVLYAIVLFLLGIASTFKARASKMTVVATAAILLVLGILYMLSIPMPEGIDLFDFFGGIA